MNRTVSTVVGIVLVVLLLVIVLRAVDRNDRPTNDLNYQVNKTADRVGEGFNDAGRKLEDATD